MGYIHNAATVSVATSGNLVIVPPYLLSSLIAARACALRLPDRERHRRGGRERGRESSFSGRSDFMASEV